MAVIGGLWLSLLMGVCGCHCYGVYHSYWKSYDCSEGSLAVTVIWGLLVVTVRMEVQYLVLENISWKDDKR